MIKSFQHLRIMLNILMFIVISSSALAVNVAIIDNDDGGQSESEFFCNIFENLGHTCTAFPTSGPTSSLDPFDVVFDLSPVWSDPDKLLVDHLHKGKGVITWGGAPNALGINTDPVVQAWIGANAYANQGSLLITIDTDPMLGNAPVGTDVGFCGQSPCTGLLDTSGHPNAKVLVRFSQIKGILFEEIGMLRNRWEGGESVYISNGMVEYDIIFRAVEILGNPIPTISTWGLLVMTLTMLIAGSVVIRKRCTA